MVQAGTGAFKSHAASPGPVTNVDAGDMIVTASVATVALVVTLGVAGVPFLDWLGAILLLVHGILLIHGSLGANARVGWLFAVLGPATIALPPFFPVLSVLLPVGTAVIVWLAAVTKPFSLW